jgi:hypothetical protein
MTRSAFFATSAAALFALGLATRAVADDAAVKCGGVNSCKGTSNCRTALSSCKGHNSCKGLGWIETASEAECRAMGGKVL